MLIKSFRVSCIILICSLTAYAAELVVVFEADTSEVVIEEILNKYSFTKDFGFISFGSSNYRAAVDYKGTEPILSVISQAEKEKQVKHVFFEIDLELNSDEYSYQNVLADIRERNAEALKYSEEAERNYLEELALQNAEALRGLEEAGDYLEKFDLQNNATVIYCDSGFLHQDHPAINELLNDGELVVVEDDDYHEYGFNFVSDDSMPEDLDSKGNLIGHGTEMASLGLAYVSRHNFMVMKVKGDDFPTARLGAALSEIGSLLEEGILSDGVVVNMSFSTTKSSWVEKAILFILNNNPNLDPDSEEDQARAKSAAEDEWDRRLNEFREEFILPLSEMGVIFVASSRKDNSANNGDEFFPGCFDEVISVGRASYSNSETDCDILAPHKMYVSDDFQSIKEVEGTSSGAALVSAFIGEILRVNPGLNSDEIRAILRYDNFTEGLNGMLNVLQGGDLPAAPEFTPEIDFAVSARIATVYSAVKDIQAGLSEYNQVVFDLGITKLEVDFGGDLPFGIEINTEFSQVVEDIKAMYNIGAEYSSEYHNEDIAYEPISLPEDTLFGIFN
ncbi:MAG: S8 family serine peptidase [Candidatus Saelkia tenebricola]|nr:S8 family serine peptidase [Candidatus Saelkia tenebricola]